MDFKWLRDSQRASNLLPGETFSFPKKFDVSSILASSYADGVDFQNKKCTMGATNDLGSIGGKPFLVQDVNDISPTINFSNRLVQSRGRKIILSGGLLTRVLQRTGAGAG